MRLTEQEKKDIFIKYSGDTSDELLLHLKRYYSVSKSDTNDLKYVNVDGKYYMLLGNKKYLVNRISSKVEERWISLGIPKIRKTVKKYLDGIK